MFLIRPLSHSLSPSSSTTFPLHSIKHIEMILTHNSSSTTTVFLSLFLLIMCARSSSSSLSYSPVQSNPTLPQHHHHITRTHFFADPAAIISRVVPRRGNRLGVGISACVHALLSSLAKAVNVLSDRLMVGHNGHWAQLKLVRNNIERGVSRGAPSPADHLILGFVTLEHPPVDYALAQLGQSNTHYMMINHTQNGGSGRFWSATATTLHYWTTSRSIEFICDSLSGNTLLRLSVCLPACLPAFPVK